ncbi:MAG: ArsA-related P-loop ATPase, partial [Myxococcota bacterium]|nr:ArsA-related P-loop ATPase [Myxococcota bacterium]
MKTKLYVCCGPGGVGKTTIAAALAIRVAQTGRKTAVLTIDPAKRLADSLQIGALRNQPVAVPLEKGRLDAMMLDPAETFDHFVLRYAPTPLAAEKLLKNRYYQFASRKMGGVQEYMAMLRLLTLFESGTYDAIILDTPPSRNALEFLKAPERMQHLMEQSALRFFSSSSGGFRALAFGAEMISKGLRLFLGAEMIEDLGLFFEHFSSIGKELHEHSKRADHLLHSENSQFFLIASPHQPIAEAIEFQQELRKEEYPFAGYIINRAPPSLSITPEDFNQMNAEQQAWIRW